MPHRILTAFSAAAFVTCLSALFIPGEPATAASAQLERSWRRCTDSNRDISIAGCTAVIDSGRETDANLAIAFYNRGIALRHQGQVDHAIQDFDRAIRLKPDDAEAFYNRGNAYYRKSQLARAIQEDERALPAATADAHLDRAIQDYDQAVRLKPDYADAFNNRGVAYYDQRQFDRAIRDYDQAIRLKPDLAEAFNNRCLAYLKLNQYDRAIGDFNETIRLHQNYGNALVTIMRGASETPRKPTQPSAA